MRTSIPERIASGEGHGRAAQKRAQAAAATLLQYVGPDGLIPEDKLQQASKQASLATNRCWAPPRCYRYASQLRLTRCPRQSGRQAH